MRKVIGIGETVLDIIFKNGQPIAAVPGGSTFNSIISLGRCGLDTMFLTETGDDRVGRDIKDFMEQNGVDSANVNVLPSKSPVSLAFLNEKNDAEYSFYREPADVHPDFRLPDVQKDDLVIYGSFYALNPAVRHQVASFLEYSKSREAILYYDVNYRPSHKKDLGEIGSSLEENMDFADVLRGSKDDFITLYGLSDVDKVYKTKVSEHCPHFICTNGAQPVQIRDIKDFMKSFPVPAIETVSTIGAGDNFNAGFIYGLVKYGITKKMIRAGLQEAQWDHLIECAHQFSAECCKSLFNYISPEFGKSRKI